MKKIIIINIKKYKVSKNIKSLIKKWFYKALNVHDIKKYKIVCKVYYANNACYKIYYITVKKKRNNTILIIFDDSKTKK